jgi:pimeloyl-ACP methyl ester carboxylesterase
MPDLPGHGLSDRPDATYDLDWYARVMEGWLEAAGVARADVVGHSFGGGVAQMMLRRCPERIRRVVLVSSGGLGREVTIALRLASIPLVVERLGQPFMGPCTRLAMLALNAGGELFTRDDVAYLAAMNAQVGSARAFARTVHGIIDWRGQRHSFLKRFSELPCAPPMAVFWGDQDTVIPFSHAEALARFLDGVRVTRFAACGHAPHLEQPDAFLTALQAFLDSPHAPAARLRPTKAPGRLATSSAAAE